MESKLYAKWEQWLYYIIIGCVSFVSLVFLPMLGSSATLAWNLPTTVAGWFVYIISKLLVAGLNILIFHCFILQAKIIVQDDPKYVEANKILDKMSPGHTERISGPEEYFRDVYGKKGIAVFATSLLSAVGLTQAVLTFDWVSMLTYFFTIFMGLIFGILQMKRTEIFWTVHYYRYALQVQEDERKAKESLEVAKEEHSEQRDDTSGDSRGTDLLESLDSDRLPGDIC